MVILLNQITPSPKIYAIKFHLRALQKWKPDWLFVQVKSELIPFRRVRKLLKILQAPNEKHLHEQSRVAVRVPVARPGAALSERAPRAARRSRAVFRP